MREKQKYAQDFRVQKKNQGENEEKERIRPSFQSEEEKSG